MAIFKDSLGNIYHSLPSKKPNPSAKSTRNKTAKRAIRPNAQAKYQRYRLNKGKPNGPGQSGNKAGKNKN